MSHGRKSSIVLLHPFGKWKTVVVFMTSSTSAARVMRSLFVKDDVSGGDATDVLVLFTSIVIVVEVPEAGSLKKKGGKDGDDDEDDKIDNVEEEEDI